MAFKKKTSNPKHPKHATPRLTGTKPSIYNNQLVISSGVASIDFILGGGLPLNSIVILEEDHYRSYSDMLLRYYIAEGILTSNHVVFSTATVDAYEFIQQLPANDEDEGDDVNLVEKESKTEDNTDMKIAIRYQGLDQMKSEMGHSSTQKFCHTFNLRSKLDLAKYQSNGANLSIINGVINSDNCEISHTYSAISIRPIYTQLVDKIQTCLKHNALSNPSNITRIALHNIGSLFWAADNSQASFQEVLLFLYQIRALTRAHPTSCLLTIPYYMFSAEQLEMLHYMADAVFRLESFQGRDYEVTANPLYSDYHGLFNLVKLPRMNSICFFIPETVSFGFKARRKRFLIEKLHLPPDITEDTPGNTKNRTKFQQETALNKSDPKSLEF